MWPGSPPQGFTAMANAWSTTLYASGDTTGAVDTTAIQTAINTATVNGGTVVLAPGTFWINAPIVPKADVHLVGSGMTDGGAGGTTGTILKLVAGSNCDMIADTTNFASNKLFFILERMRLDGNKANVTSGNGINFSPAGAGHDWDVTIRDVYIVNVHDIGILSTDCHDYILDHVIVEGAGSDGVQFTGGNTASIFGGVYKANGADGINVNPVGGAAVHVSIYGNVVSNNQNDGIRVGAKCQVFSNALFTNGQAANNTWAGIIVYYGLDTAVFDNHVDGSGATALKYCIQIVGNTNTKNVRVHDNHVVGAATAQIVDQTGGAIPNKIHDNTGFNPVGWATVTPGVGSTGADVQNVFGYPVDAYITGVGTGVSAVGITDPAGTLTSFTRTVAVGEHYRVDAGGKIRLTYTGSPTWAWYGL